MSESIGWNFPPTNGGEADGFNDLGMSHFKGSPLSSLSRETLQNSLDAFRSDGAPVYVSFDLVDLDPGDVCGNELFSAVKACEEAPLADDAARQSLDVARGLLESGSVPCLRISDRNTTGLLPDQWRALVKAKGVSVKPGVEGAGGQHGAGKFAPFAVSDLRTVFYWTCYDGEAVGIEGEVECFQGKSVLMSHDGPLGETQGTGFFGVKQGCRELRGDSIPGSFRLLDSDLQSLVKGTSLSIAGFRAQDDWRIGIASSVIENFFYAIDRKRLVVMVEPDASLVERGLIEIDSASLAGWFDYLEEHLDESEYQGEEDIGALKEARAFWGVADESADAVERTDPDLGTCRLWIKVQDGLPNKVGFVRRTGMLVTTQQRGLLRFPGYRDFAALCVFDDPGGNELLRRMENARHDQFEPDRLPEAEREKGRKALKRITDWVRREIRRHAGPPPGGRSTVLAELATYLPDFQPDEPFDGASEDGDGGSEPGFADQVRISIKKVRRPVPKGLDSEEDGEDDEGDAGAGDDVGDFGGGNISNGHGLGNGNGNGHGAGDGEGTGGTGGKGGGQASLKRVDLTNVRMVPVPGSENTYRLSFNSAESGVVQLHFEEAGDSSAMRRDDVRSAEEDVSLDSLQVYGNTRSSVIVTSDASIGGRSWRLTALGSGGS